VVFFSCTYVNSSGDAAGEARAGLCLWGGEAIARGEGQNRGDRVPGLGVEAHQPLEADGVGAVDSHDSHLGAHGQIVDGEFAHGRAQEAPGLLLTATHATINTNCQ
jgi:hypothetical protein